jgi:hypothetical protein
MTDQETILYEALSSGNWDLIDAMRPGDNSEPDLHEEFEVDYKNAYDQYQRDHELPEEEREQLTTEVVEQENQEAPTEEV